MTAAPGARSRFETLRAYERDPLSATARLRLDANEGAPPDIEFVLSALREQGSELLCRYPDARPLEAELAQRFGVEKGQVFVGAGADDVLDRCCRAFLPPGSALLMAEPGFDVFAQYAALGGARLIGIPWHPGAYPLDAVRLALNEQVAVIAFVTPNNPTGEVATVDDLRAVAGAAPQALVILDHAYVEFADDDLTAAALTLPNVVMIRTFSKAWGLAGCRVGYAIGPEPIVRMLRVVGGPYPVAAPSLAIARVLADRGAPRRDAYVARIRSEREALFALLTNLGANPRRSQANFVFAEIGTSARAVHSTLATAGIVVRSISSARSGEPLGLRITLPGDPVAFEALTAAVRRAFAGAVE